MRGQNPQEYSWNSEEPHEEAIPVARSPGVGGGVFGARPWEGPGALGRARAEVTAEEIKEGRAPKGKWWQTIGQLSSCR